MSIYLRKDSPYYWYDFVRKGQRYYGSTGLTDKKEAQEYEASIRHNVAKEEQFGEKPREMLPLGQALTMYYEQAAKDFAQPKNELKRLKTIATILGSNTLFHEIDDRAIGKLVRSLRTRPSRERKGKMIAPATINRHVEALRRVYKRAKGMWKVRVGDEPNWGELLLAEPNERIRELSSAEEKALLPTLREDYLPMIRFALLGGMRLNNIISLRWEQIDFEHSMVKLKLKSKLPGGRDHTIPITAKMRALLDSQAGNHPEFVFTYVCKKSRGARKKGQRYPFSQNGWRKEWQAALVRAGIKDFRFHDTRHTAATRTLRASKDLKAVSVMLGHTDIGTTSRYAHVLHDDVLAAMEKAQSHDSPTKKRGAKTTR